MSDQDFKDKLAMVQLIGEAQGIMRGLIAGNLLPDHENNVCKNWIEKTDKHFNDKLKETE